MSESIDGLKRKALEKEYEDLKRDYGLNLFLILANSNILNIVDLLNHHPEGLKVKEIRKALAYINTWFPLEEHLDALVVAKAVRYDEEYEKYYCLMDGATLKRFRDVIEKERIFHISDRLGQRMSWDYRLNV